MTLLAPPPFDPALFRFNEGACDAAGRFWVGVMFDPLDDAIPPQESSLHSFTLREGLRTEPDSAELHNGMAWSPDGRRSICHIAIDERFSLMRSTRQPADWACAISSHRSRRFLVCPMARPSNSQGGYWCALHGGSRLRRYTAMGAVDRDIALPVSQPTMCAFAGAALDVLYVTTASDKLSPEQKEREPLAGALLRLRPGERGIVRPCTLR